MKLISEFCHYIIEDVMLSQTCTNQKDVRHASSIFLSLTSLEDSFRHSSPDHSILDIPTNGMEKVNILAKTDDPDTIRFPITCMMSIFT